MRDINTLKRNNEFKRVYSRGVSRASKCLVVYVVHNNKKETRIGIAVSKKVGKSVVRSRITRLIRESYRSVKQHVKEGYDIVVVARVFVNECTYHQVNASLKQLLSRHNVVQA